MIKFFKKIIDWFRYRHMDVIADASDNSITLSRSLFKHMGGLELDQAKVFMFKIPTAGRRPQNSATRPIYAFTINPEFPGDANPPLADIQYNSKYKSIGFETLNPTVNRIFYDYGMPALVKVKLTVKPKKTAQITYYQICPPQ